MTYADFVKAAIEQNNRNQFAKYDGSLDIVPDEIKGFYRDFNPVDVEVDDDGVGVSFWSAKGLPQLQKEYGYLDAQFVFATCNSDPIFFHDGRIYTCAHGVNEPEWEELASGFEAYLEFLSQHVDGATSHFN